MGLPVVTVASGGLPVNDQTSGSKVGMAVTEATYGIPVTKVASGGVGVVYVMATGGPVAPPFTPTTWNPSDKGASVTLSNGNLTFSSASTNQGVRAAVSQSSGKYYFEATFTSMTGYVGLAQATTVFNGTLNAVGVAPSSGWVQVNGASIINITAGLASPVAMAVDLGAKRIWFRSAPSGNWNGNASYDPAAGTGGVDISSITGAPLYPAVLMLASGNSGTANFGASAFTGAVPSGFTAGWG